MEINALGPCDDPGASLRERLEIRERVQVVPRVGQLPLTGTAGCDEPTVCHQVFVSWRERSKSVMAVYQISLPAKADGFGAANAQNSIGYGFRRPLSYISGS